MYAAGEPDMPPLSIGGGIADQMGAIILAYGVLAALVARERHAVGQEVDASHLGSMMMLPGLGVSARLLMGFAPPRSFRARAANPLWNHFRCSDGHWIALAMLQPDRYWTDLCNALGRPDLAGDPRFATLTERAQHAAEVIAILDEVFTTRPRDEWLRILHEAPGDFIFTRVNRVDDPPDDAQVRANGYVVDFEHPAHGKIPVLGMPVRLSETPGEVRLPAPELGPHTEEVLLDLDYDWDQIAALRAAKAI